MSHFKFSFSAESLGDISGVSRAFWEDVFGNHLDGLTKNKYYPSHPDFLHVIPTFDPPKDVADNYGQVLEAYFKVRVVSNYLFCLYGYYPRPLLLLPRTSFLPLQQHAVFKSCFSYAVAKLSITTSHAMQIYN